MRSQKFNPHHGILAAIRWLTRSWPPAPAHVAVAIATLLETRDHERLRRRRELVRRITQLLLALALGLGVMYAWCRRGGC